MEPIPFKEYVESSRTGVWLIDADQVTTFVNPKMCGILDLEAKELIGKPFSPFLPAGLVVQIQSAIGQLRKLPNDQAKEFLRYQKGEQTFFQVTISLAPASNSIFFEFVQCEALSQRDILMSAVFDQSKDWQMLLVLQNDGQLYIQDTNAMVKEIYKRFKIPWPLKGLSGIPVSELLANHFKTPKATVAKRIAQYKRVIKTGQIEVTHPRKALEIAPNYFYEAVITPIHPHHGACNTALVTIRDVTSSVATSNALASSEEKFKTLFDQSTMGEFEFHKYSTQVSFNRAARKILQIPDDVSVIDISPSVFANKLLPGGLEQVLNTKQVIRLETEFSPSHYRERHQFPTLLTSNIFLDISIVPIDANNEGRPTSFLVQVRDITEKLKSERALQSAFDELKQLRSQLEQENYYLREAAALGSDFGDIIFSGEKLKMVLAEVEQVASTDATVLILGETGTGKELVAKAIHNISPRKARPLIKLNCAALPKELIESELFGHEKGAFTGAINRKIGRFELADGGTIFLDEIGELPIELQPKLLRVLQEGEFERVGGTETKKINVRVVAATNRDLEEEMKAGNFRPDLYYRLNVFPVNMPPLRARKEDIPSLVWFFVKKFNSKFQKNIDKIPERLMQWMQIYQWPGNVRELENLIERAMILAKTDTLSPEAFPIRNPIEDTIGPPQDLAQVKRAHILKILGQYRWIINGELGAAKALGLKPSTLRDQMKKLGIVRPVKGQ